jgi:hypothetical protein
MSEATDLATVTMADFEALRGRTLRISANGETMDIVIAELNAVTGPQRPGGAFSVVFRGPRQPVVEQATHRIEVDGAPAMELFLVPLGPDGEGMLYEAVFN